MQQFQLADSSVGGSNTLSILEEYVDASHSTYDYSSRNKAFRSSIMETLGYYRADVQSADLSSLEISLELAIASVYWRGRSSLRVINDYAHSQNIFLAATRSWDNFTSSTVDPNSNTDNASAVTISVNKHY